MVNILTNQFWKNCIALYELYSRYTRYMNALNALYSRYTRYTNALYALYSRYTRYTNALYALYERAILCVCAIRALYCIQLRTITLAWFSFFLFFLSRTITTEFLFFLFFLSRAITIARNFWFFLVCVETDHYGTEFLHFFWPLRTINVVWNYFFSVESNHYSTKFFFFLFFCWEQLLQHGIFPFPFVRLRTITTAQNCSFFFFFRWEISPAEIGTDLSGWYFTKMIMYDQIYRVTGWLQLVGSFKL